MRRVFLKSILRKSRRAVCFAWNWSRNNKKRAIWWAVGLLFFLLAIGVYVFLRPGTWRYYTDEISILERARDVEPEFVAWEKPHVLPGLPQGLNCEPEPALSPDGALLIFTREEAGSRDLFSSRWNGQRWEAPSPLRALNSKFNERSPAFSVDGRMLYFATDRPGSLGNYDIWVSRWDGAEYSWPLPLTQMVNSPFNELDPAPSASGHKLYFTSDRPERPLTGEEEAMNPIEVRESVGATDFDIFEADLIPAGVTNREVERATSMLYYLREGALADDRVMKLLGGSGKSEAAVSKALAWLAKNQEEDGHWSMAKHGGSGQHDIAGTAFALLAYLGRGERHDRPCKYRDTVQRAVDWLVTKQDQLTGDLRGRGDMYDHGIATLALVEAYGVTKHEDLVLPAQTAIEFIVDSQNTGNGGWRYKPRSSASDLSVSGWMIMALKSADLSGLRVPAKTLELVRKWLEKVSGGKHGGIYSYQGEKENRPAMVATGYFCCQLMGLSPNTFRSFETANYIRGKTKQQHVMDSYFCYYATLSSYQNQGKLWRNWQKFLQKHLPNAQNEDGFWNPGGKHAGKMGRIVGTSLMTLSLQAHYRYTPLYGLGFQPEEEGDVTTVNFASLPDMPVYRRAKILSPLNSLAHDRSPYATGHGDFLYFCSNRRGGEGGFDLYKARVSGQKPGSPLNLGGIINTGNDETGPALRMHGFNLVFGSTADGTNRYSVSSTTSRRVFREERSKTIPELKYLALVWKRALILLLSAGALLFVVARLRPRKGAS